MYSHERNKHSNLLPYGDSSAPHLALRDLLIKLAKGLRIKTIEHDNVTLSWMWSIIMFSFFQHTRKTTHWWPSTHPLLPFICQFYSIVSCCQLFNNSEISSVIFSGAVRMFKFHYTYMSHSKREYIYFKKNTGDIGIFHTKSCLDIINDKNDYDHLHSCIHSYLHGLWFL